MGRDMDPVKRTWLQCGVAAVVLVIGLAIGANTSQSQGGDPSLIFGTDAGIVLTFVQPDKTDDFERVLAYLEEALRQSDNPIRRQQAEHWQVYKSADPGPDGAVFYVSYMQPVLKGADYNIAHILGDELPKGRAEELVGMLTSTLAQRQSTLSLEDVMHLTDPPVEPELSDDSGDDDEEQIPAPDPTLEVAEEATAP